MRRAAVHGRLGADGGITIDTHERPPTMNIARGRHQSGRQSCVRGRFEPLEARRVLDSTLTLAITEIMYNPVDPSAAELAINDMFDNDDFEFIELQNTGDMMIGLNGVTLTTPSFTFEFAGSNVTSLAAGDYVLLVRNQQGFEARYGTGMNGSIAGTYSDNLGNGGDTIAVTDGVAEIIHDFDYDDGGGWPGRADGNGSSLEVKDVGGDYNDPDNWRNSGEFNGTPGAAGLGPVNTVVVNEVLSHTDPPLTDTIELHNPTDQPIDVGGWYLSDTDGDYQKFRIPDGTVIGAGGYVTFDETDFNPSMGVDPNDFSLDSAEGDEVWLLAGDAAGNLTRFVDHVTFGAQLNGESWGRWPDGDGDLFPMASRTLGAANSGPRVGPVVLTEIMYNPPDPGIMGVAASDMEFIEIHNPTASAVDLTEWRLRGESDFDFPAAFSLPGGGTIVVVSFDPNNAELMDAFRDVYGLDPGETVPGVNVLGPYLGLLNNSGATVRLQRPDTPQMDGFVPRLLEDEVDYDDDAPWPVLADGAGGSLARLAPNLWGNDPASWVAAQPTPGDAAVGPPVLIVTVDPLVTNDVTPPLTGTVTDPAATVAVTVNGVEYAATNNGDGTWTVPDGTITPPLPHGVYDVLVTATNAGGPRTDATTDELNVDLVAPIATVHVLSTADDSPELTGAVDDPLATVEVAIAGMTYAAENHGDGTWTLADDTISPALAEGFHNVDVTVRDAVGNSAVAYTKIHVVFDATARPWRNPDNFMDVDGDMVISFDDAQTIFDDLNANGIRQLPPEQGGAAPFLDVNGDGLASWVDALIVINLQNRLIPPEILMLAAPAAGPLDPQTSDAAADRVHVVPVATAAEAIWHEFASRAGLDAAVPDDNYVDVETADIAVSVADGGYGPSAGAVEALLAADRKTSTAASQRVAVNAHVAHETSDASLEALLDDLFN